MKMLMSLSVGILLVLTVGCGGVGVNTDGASAPTKAPINTNFYQQWVHAYEAQNGQKTPNIFRPKGSQEFPPSRFRMQFAFDQNGQCNYMYLSPTDAHEIRDCVYTKIDNKVYLYDNAGGSLSHLAFTIQSLSQNEMKLTYGVAAPVTKEAKKKKVVPQ